MYLSDLIYWMHRNCGFQDLIYRVQSAAWSHRTDKLFGNLKTNIFTFCWYRCPDECKNETKTQICMFPVKQRVVRQHSKKMDLNARQASKMIFHPSKSHILLNIT